MTPALPALLALLAPRAQAAEVVAGGYGSAIVRVGGSGDAAATAGGGVGGEIGLVLAPRVLLEAQADAGGAGGVGPLGSAGLGVRWYLTEPWQHSRSVALLGGAGVGWRNGPSSVATIGAALELPRRHRVIRRIQLRYVAETASGLDQSGASSIQLALGAAVVPASLIAPRIDPPEAMVWLPHPICDWVPASEADERLADIEEGQRFEIVAENHAPHWVEGPPPPVLTLPEVPSQGSLVIVARPGDRVVIGGDPVALSSSGTAVVNSREGEVEITVVGGGRSHEMLAGVVDGYATWVRAPEPEPILIRFPAGSAELTEEARAAITGVARRAGDWSFALSGSHSPEGEETINQQLARDRSIAVHDALVLAGVPPQRLALRDPYEPERTAPLADQRACQVLPMASGVGL